MNDTKKVGRPRNFLREDALLAAINVFWQKGYDGASMKDLTQGMGINGPSLYSTFGDKQELYLQAIDAYATSDACAPLTAFENEQDIKLAVLKFMEAAIDYATDHHSGAKGCFLSSCVSTTSGEIEGVDNLLQTAIEGTDNKLAKRFDQEIAKGNLPKDFPSLERASLMFDLRQGHVFRARAGLSGEAMKQGLQQRVKMILQV